MKIEKLLNFSIFLIRFTFFFNFLKFRTQSLLILKAISIKQDLMTITLIIVTLRDEKIQLIITIIIIQSEVITLTSSLPLLNIINIIMTTVATLVIELEKILTLTVIAYQLSNVLQAVSCMYSEPIQITSSRTMSSITIINHIIIMVAIPTTDYKKERITLTIILPIPHDLHDNNCQRKIILT